MQNSSMQLRNVLKAFCVADAPVLAGSADASSASSWFEWKRGRGARGSHEYPAKALLRRVGQVVRELAGAPVPSPALPPGPVLLVDDMVDSGWTLTLAGVLLRRRGSGPVYPFALAKASPRGG
jgi:hypothetical protein